MNTPVTSIVNRLCSLITIAPPPVARGQRRVFSSALRRQPSYREHLSAAVRLEVEPNSGQGKEIVRQIEKITDWRNVSVIELVILIFDASDSEVRDLRIAIEGMEGVQEFGC